ncbi:MAG: hypothetical protein WBF06_01815 [Candidatus Acidiferrales bacterium]
MRHLLATLLVATIAAAALAAKPPQSAPGQDQPPSPAEVQMLSQRVIANQHRNDQLLDQYERIEHDWIRKAGTNPPVTQETLNRVLPTGTGIMRLPLAAPGKPADPTAYRAQLEYLANVLTMVANPDATEQQTLARYSRRQKDRADLVTNVGNAFHFSWLGREMRDGHPVIKLQMDPNPDFHATTPTAQVLQHLRAVVWIDESTAQVVHLEAAITSDVWFGAGIIAKLYRGGRFVMDQAEVAPGVWEPVRYQYDFDGRKFIFPYADHEITEFSQYRRVGSPAEELQAVRNELNTSATDPPRP